LTRLLGRPVPLAFLALLLAFTPSGAHATTKPPLLADAQRLRSQYLELAGQRNIGEPTTLLRATIRLSRTDTVFFQSDGTYRPQGPSAANVYIAVDGRKSSTDSLVDWRTSEQPTAHPFDAVGALRLRAGRHTVELIAEPASWLPLCINHDCTPVGAASPGGSFVVAAASLSVLVHPATRVVSRVLSSDRGPFDIDTAGLLAPDDTLTGPLPFTELLSATVQRGAASVAFGSGWLYAAAPLSSDAMLTFVVDGRHPGNHRASWANQDLWRGAETRGPLSTQMFLPPQGRARQVALATVEYPWNPTWVPGQPDNPAVYSVATGTGMTVLTGGMTVAGSTTSTYDNAPTSSTLGVGSSTGDPYSAPVGTNVELASADVLVPRRHSGVVMFSAKSRTHGGDGFDTGWTSSGTISMWITIDGKRRGPVVLQQVLPPGNSGSQRSIAVSYLAAGGRALRPGYHRVQVWGRADGSFFHAWMWRDLPLLWFD
jgi:hypothetical protein